MTLLFCFSLLVDLLWLVLIPWRTWFHPEYERQVPFEHGLHVTATALVFINLALKAASIALSFFFDPRLKSTFQQTLAETVARLQKSRAY